MLDVLSGRSAYDGGTITLDGEIVTEKIMKKLKKRVAYVKQSDLFFGHLTVRDQLTYTAFLRLPSSWNKAQKIGEVDRIIKQVSLLSEKKEALLDTIYSILFYLSFALRNAQVSVFVN